MILVNMEYDDHSQFEKYLGKPWLEFEDEISKEYACDFSTYYDKKLPNCRYCYIAFGDTIVRFFGTKCVAAVQQFGFIKEKAL